MSLTLSNARKPSLKDKILAGAKVEREKAKSKVEESKPPKKKKSKK